VETQGLGRIVATRAGNIEMNELHHSTMPERLSLQAAFRFDPVRLHTCRVISFPQTKLKKPAIQAIVAQLIHSLARKRACQLLLVIASIYFCKLKAGVDPHREAMGDR
jgi:hypothetical protein